MKYLIWLITGHPDGVGFFSHTDNSLTMAKGEPQTTLVIDNAWSGNLTEAMELRTKLRHYGDATIIAPLE